MHATSSVQPTVIDLTPTEFVQMEHPPLLVDVCSGFEYSLFHAPHAINVSLPRILMGRIPGLRRWLLPQWFQNQPKTEAIALICLTAHRSPIAAEQLLKAGFTKVFNITGGIVAWRKAGLPVYQGRKIINGTIQSH